MRRQFRERLRDGLDELSSRKLLKVEQEIASPSTAASNYAHWATARS